MPYASKDLIGRVMAAGALTVFSSALAVPLVWGGFAVALWGGLVSAFAAAVFLVVAAVPATLGFAALALLLGRAGLGSHMANVSTFVTVTALALFVLSAVARASDVDLPLHVWLTPMVMATVTAIWAFRPATGDDAGGMS